MLFTYLPKCCVRMYCDHGKKCGPHNCAYFHTKTLRIVGAHYSLIDNIIDPHCVVHSTQHKRLVSLNTWECTLRESQGSFSDSTIKIILACLMEAIALTTLRNLLVWHHLDVLSPISLVASPILKSISFHCRYRYFYWIEISVHLKGFHP